MTEKLKKKPRMTCKQYCPVWNDIDKDCEIYGEHHFTPKTCPHYNIEILEKKMIEKFIEEYYDTQNTKNEQQKDLRITSEQLTEQWKKGKLPSGWYYLKVNEELANCPVISECVDDYDLGLPLSYFYDFDVAKIEQVLAEVPDYVEWKNMVNCACEEHEANKRLIEENAQLKELLKECELWFTGTVGNMNDKNYGEHNRNLPIGNFEHIFMVFSQKINEVLK